MPHADEPRPGAESGSDDEDVAPQAPNTVNRRRKAQKDIFERWILSASANGTFTEKSKTNSGTAQNVADEELSIHSLLAKQGERIIKNPRQYQQELFERAQKENTIAVLDTGSGKTLIAGLLLRWIIDGELERRAAGHPPMIAFFLVTSVTLVYQQFEVLKTNIDQPMARVCGADNADHWDRLKWKLMFSENKIIVCTADILQQCLARSYIKMSEINLLVFDEAHHTKKNHAYARIVKDYYTSTEPSVRPRIFGMTASPVDAKTNIVQAAIELETLLDSKIATTQDMSFQGSVSQPVEEVVKYRATQGQQFETSLLKDIKAHFSCAALSFLDEQFAASTDIARHLGRWCGDRSLIETISQDNLAKYERKLEKEFYYGRSKEENPHVVELDKKIALLRQVVAYVDSQQDKYHALGRDGLSPKVITLVQYLKTIFVRPTGVRCIIFVQARKTARMLDEVFTKLGLPHVRSGHLTGSNAADAAVQNFTFRRQVLTLLDFRNDKINCLFATSVAEEGLDVPDCNLVIRFDTYSTMIQYVQSRGRARQKGSKFIHMIEKGNDAHALLLGEVRWQEKMMRAFCEALPEDRRLLGNEDKLEDIVAREANGRVYVEPATGAKLNYGNSLSYLAIFVSAIPSEAEDNLYPAYRIEGRGKNFIAEVVIPGSKAPIRSVMGRECTKKSLAKRSAAFEACLLLREKQYMDAYLMPIYQKKLPALRNALLAVNTKKKNKYNVRTKPSAWEDTRGVIPDRVWVTIVDFPDGLDRPHRPLAMLSRTRLPDFPSFLVFPDNGEAKTVTSRQLEETLEFGEDRMKQFAAFTFRIFRDVFAKTYEDSDGSILPYWLAPVVPSTAASAMISIDNPSAELLLDWNLLQDVLDNDEYTWTPATPPETLVDRFLVDKWDGTRRLYSKAIAEDLKPLDPVPDNTAKSTGTVAAKLQKQTNILEYSISLWKKSREKIRDWHEDQPVVEAELTSTRRNWLTPPSKKDFDFTSRAFVVAEPLRISALTTDVVASCFAWPSIIHRFEACMIAVEACSKLGVQCEPRIALAAMTKDSDHNGDYDQGNIKFQQGMGENYERLEFMGDTFLKTATTISTFTEKPNDDEYEYHCTRMGMVCNANLFRTAVDLELFEYIRSAGFDRRLWYPEGLKLLAGATNKDVEEKRSHFLGEKTIADVAEALIGAALVSHHKPGAWEESRWENAVYAVTKLVDDPGHTMLRWDDYRKAYKMPEWQEAQVTASQRDLTEKVEREHPYHFNFPRLLRSAFLHPSEGTMTERVPHYQRLEFLGDSLLDMACISYLFYRFPDKDPQWLTEHKMAMVSNRFLGAACVNIGFYKHLRHSSSIMQYQIKEYVTELHEAKRTAGSARDYWTTVSDPPKCLPDIVEAYVGAIFIDSNFDYNVVQRFFDAQIQWYFEDMSIYDSYANNHPCTHLHNLLQSAYACQDYRLMAREMPAFSEGDKKDVVAVVMIHNEIVSHSKGSSGRYARLRASKDALDVLKGMLYPDFRNKFKCDCKEKAMDGMGTGKGVAVTEEPVAMDCAV